MSEELQKPPVVDIDAILRPIEGDNPSGESLRYVGLYDEINEARRADDTLSLGEWQSELKAADYRQVINLAVPALTDRSKDLQIAAWLSESLVKEYGFAGLRDGLKIVAGLQENFWDTLFPEIDEGDMEGRANAVSWLDTHTTAALKRAPFTAGQGFGYTDWEDAKRFDFPEDVSALDTAEQERWADLRQQAENERRVTGEMWRRAKSQTRRRFVEEIDHTLSECFEVFGELNRVIEEKFERNQMPGLSNMKKALDDVQTQVKKLLDEKRAEEPDEIDAAAEFEAVSSDGSPVAAGTSGASTGAVQSRQDALRRLAEIAAFFQRTEPHSPVAYLVQRAVKWGNMPLEGWLRDVIQDENVLYALRQTLGLDTGGSGSAGDNGGYSETAAEDTSADSW